MIAEQSPDKKSLHEQLVDLAAEGATLRNMVALFNLLPDLEVALRPSLAPTTLEVFLVEAMSGMYEPSFWTVCAYATREDADAAAKRLNDAADALWAARKELGDGPDPTLSDEEFEKVCLEFDTKRSALLGKWRSIGGDQKLDDYDETEYTVSSLALHSSSAPSPLAAPSSVPAEWFPLAWDTDRLMFKAGNGDYIPPHHVAHWLSSTRLSHTDAPVKYRMEQNFGGGDVRVVHGEYPSAPSSTAAPGPCVQCTDPTFCQWGKNCTRRSAIGLKWAPVSERLPEGAGVTVLLNCAGELLSTGYLQSDGTFKVDADHPSDGAAWIVTHWMPLPSAPMDDNSDGRKA